MTPAMRRELTLLGLWLLAFLLVGLLVGQVAALLITGLLGYLLWVLYNVNRLARWLHKPSGKIPESRGIWDEIYYLIYHLYQRQRKARRKLASMLSRFQASTEALPYATIVLNASNEIEWFNPAAQRLFSLHPRTDIGQRIDNLVRLPAFTKYLAKRKFNKPLEFALNQQVLLLNITSYGSGQYLLTARDITLRSQLDDMRRDFIANASHELRTPVTVIKGYIEALCERAPEDERQVLQKVQQQTVRMNTIIDELIELARLESLDEVDDSEQVDVKHLLDDIYAAALELDQDKHKITLEVADDDLASKFYGRYQDVRIAIMNLVSNAVRYTPTGKGIKLFVEHTGQTITIGVKDNGIGIPYEHIPRLTERFYRVDEGRPRDQGGTGLGLAIVKHVMEKHGGVLRINSQLGAGSTFRCEFPAVAAHENLVINS